MKPKESMTMKKKIIIGAVAGVLAVSGYVFAQGYSGLIAPGPQDGKTSAAANAAGGYSGLIAPVPQKNGQPQATDLYGYVENGGPMTRERQQELRKKQVEDRQAQRLKDIAARRAAQEQKSSDSFKPALDALAKQRAEQEALQQQQQRQMAP